MTHETAVPPSRAPRTRRSLTWLLLLVALSFSSAASAQRSDTETICASTLSAPDGAAELLASPLLRSLGGLLSSLRLDGAPPMPDAGRVDRSERGYLLALRLSAREERATPSGCAPRTPGARRAPGRAPTS